MDRFLPTTILTFAVALGVTLGGSFMGALAAFFTGRPPLKTMIDLAVELKIWAVVAALGGTFGVIRVFEAGVFGKQFFDLARQMVVVCCAFFGAHVGYLIVISLGAER